MSRTFGWLLATMFTLAVCHSACTIAQAADDSVLAELYGNGVHAYFSGDSKGAYEQLTGAVDAGTEDPRVYYFRALAYLQLGRDPEAKTDFEKGASLEVADVNNQYPVNRSLERIQGQVRTTLEGYRAKARMVVFQQSQRDRQQRYGTNRASDAVLNKVESTPLQLHATPDMNAMPKQPAVMRTPAPVHAEPAPVAAEQAVGGAAVPPAVTAPAAKSSDVIDPFSLDVKQTPSAPMPTTAPVATSVTPVTPAAEATPVASPVAPSGAPPAVSSAKAAGTADAAKDSADPFADEAAKGAGPAAAATTPTAAPAATPAAPPAVATPAPATPGAAPSKNDDDPFK